MRGKIKEVEQYFISRIINTDFNVIDYKNVTSPYFVDSHRFDVSIDDYRFSFLVSKVGFCFYGGFIQIEINDSDSLSTLLELGENLYKNYLKDLGTR